MRDYLFRVHDNSPTPSATRRETSRTPLKDFSDNCQEEIAVMKIKPLRDRIIVRRLSQEEKTKGGIIIPDTAKEKPQEGEVIAVGNGKVLDDGKVVPLELKKGDKILFGKYAGTEIKVDGEELLIVREDEVLGVIG
jgi:chaperonin GroES